MENLLDLQMRLDTLTNVSIPYRGLSAADPTRTQRRSCSKPLPADAPQWAQGCDVPTHRSKHNGSAQLCLTPSALGPDLIGLQDGLAVQGKRCSTIGKEVKRL